MITRFTIFVLFFLLIFSCRNKVYNSDEAIRSLKVLNSDLNNLFVAGGDLEEIKALNFLWEQKSAPLPWPKEKFTLGYDYQPYIFDESKGKYFWDPDSVKFIKQEENKELILLFTTSKLQKARFQVSEFQNAVISSRPEFPLLINARLFIDEKELLKTEHRATVEDDLLKTMKTSVKGVNYSVEGNLNRTREANSGQVTIRFIFDYQTKNLIQFDLQAAVGYSAMGYFFEKIEFEITLFSHHIEGKIDYDKINPTAEDYAKSFNSNSKIEIFEMPGKKKVGDVVLATLPGGNLLDYHIKFADGSIVLVQEYLPFIDKILNLKL